MPESVASSHAAHLDPAQRPLVAFGPEKPGIGSWEWLGADFVEELSERYRTTIFHSDVPECDVAVVVKYLPSVEKIMQAAEKVPVIFMPVDHYGSTADLDAHWKLHTACARVIVHAESLRPYLQSYARVESLDHPVKFCIEPAAVPVDSGPVLWTGVPSNLPPVVDWVNQHGLPAHLLVLTDVGSLETAASFGFREPEQVTLEQWSRTRHLEALKVAALALDVKGDDFRQQHKPPTKALDLIASGVPVAVNPGSPAVDQLLRMGFEVCCADDWDRWQSQQYLDETRAFGSAVRELLSRRRVGLRLARIIDQVLDERRRR